MIARYFFHLHDGAFVADREGMEFPDWQSASARAVSRAAEVISARGTQFWEGEHLRIVVTDAIGTPLFELRLSGHLPLDRNILGPHEPAYVN